MRRAILTTAFLEGLSVLIIEIAGARAVAPYYGTSLQVWTAQITATLLCLALGYGLGGRLAASRNDRLPQVLWAAGVWLALFPWLRAPLLTLSHAVPSLPVAAWMASLALFGPALLGLGAVSPLLIQRLEKGQGAGAAAGGVFFTNTLGGLLGGWLTALVFLPHGSLRLLLGLTGLGLVLVGSAWAWRSRKAVAAAAPLLMAVLVAVAPEAARSQVMGNGSVAVVLARRSSGNGLVMVTDFESQGRSAGLLLSVDGITQGGMDRASGLTAFEFTEYLARLSWIYHPQARTALLLGLGSGLLAKQLEARGLQVEVAEIEPQMEPIAREFFGLPPDVVVHHADARDFLARSDGHWDLVFLDCFAGENAPWYLLTQEGLQAIRAHLAPGGRLLINTVTRPVGSSGLERIEAGLAATFSQGRAYVDRPPNEGAGGLVNACLVAGAGLVEGSAPYPGHATARIRERSDAFVKLGRALKPGPVVDTDDESGLDWADAGLRAQWRAKVLEQLGAPVLGD